MEWHTVSLVPRPPPFFVLLFAFTIIHRSRRAAKNMKGLGTPITWIMSVGHKVDMGGCCPSTNLCAINDGARFLPVKLSIVNLVNSGPSYRWSTRWWSLVHYLNVDPSLPYIHPASTRRHSCDRCSRPSPFFTALLLPCIIERNPKKKNKTGEPWERGEHKVYMQ